MLWVVGGWGMDGDSSRGERWSILKGDLVWLGLGSMFCSQIM